MSMLRSLMGQRVATAALSKQTEKLPESPFDLPFLRFMFTQAMLSRQPDVW